MNQRCAFITMGSMQGWVCDDDLAIPALGALGWEVEKIPWREREVDWRRFDIVVIRSPWDYPTDAPLFLANLEEIEASGTLLLNPLELVRWNLHKSYLARLAARKVSVVPTRWLDQPGQNDILEMFAEFETDTLVIKPSVGANAEHAHVLRAHRIEKDWPTIEPVFEHRQSMVQPFRTAIQTEGEYSLMFMDGELSHAIRKKPMEGDFRSQEEHGADISPAKPEPLLAQRAGEAVAALSERPLYARADMIRNPEGDFEVMELELIEPSLYLRMEPGAPERFARAIVRRAESGRK
jgi:glutathione synthase/RimK-type ligase-like ATP-grasp enzyme